MTPSSLSYHPHPSRAAGERVRGGIDRRRGRGRRNRRRRSLATALAVLCLAAVAPFGAAVPATAQQPTGSVVGTVLTEAGEAIVGAQVVLEGTQRGTVTDERGRFLLTNVPAGEREIRIVSLGYRSVTETVEVAAGESASVEFRLAVSAIALDEVVVTGTAGGSERRALGNLVTRVQAPEAVELAAPPSLQSLLNGRAPGVVIAPGTGMVGSGSQIRVRGASSLSLSNQPLLYVDGVRVDNAQATGPAVQAFGSSVISRLNDFNPEDIESIEVIRGPAAATLYGTEASNGVIQIITKRGAEGDPRWNLTVRQGVNAFVDAEDRIYTNYWRNPETDQVESLNLVAAERADGREIFRDGHLQNYSLSVRGGSPELRYYVGGDMDREEGAEPDNRMRRASARANVTLVPSDAFEINANVGYVGARYDLSCEAGCGGMTWAALFSTPEHAQGDDPRRGARSNPPEYYAATTDRFQDLGRFTGGLTIRHQPATWFTHRLTYGLDEVREDNQEITEKTAYYLEWNPSGTGGKFVGRRDVSSHTVDYSGTVDYDLSPEISSSTSFGMQFFRQMTKFVSVNGNDFAVPGLRVIAAAADVTGSESFVEQANAGIFAQQRFGWNDRGFVTLGLRADDHSAFGEEFELVYYPKVSGTWVVSEEPFWGLSPVSELRLRTAYGQTGQQPGAFDALRTYSAVPGPDDASTVTPGTVGNPALGPERGREVELGFDAGLLDDRIGLELTWYDQKTRDAILLQPVAPSEGFPGSRFVNVGEIGNRGFETTLRATPVVSPSLDWDVTFSLARNTSEVFDIGDGRETIVVSSGFGVEHRVGGPVGGWYHRRVLDADFDADGRVITDSMVCDDGDGGTTPCYVDGEATAPRVFLGTSDPEMEGSFSSTVSLDNGLRFYGLVDFKTGFRKWDHVTRVRCSLFNVCLENANPTEFVDEDPATLASYQTGDTFGAAYINDASFAKLRELSVSYRLPVAWVERFGASGGSVSLAARNLYTWSDWTGLEPEARFLSGARGGFGPLEQNHLPQLTSFVTSFNLTF